MIKIKQRWIHKNALTKLLGIKSECGKELGSVNPRALWDTDWNKVTCPLCLEKLKELDATIDRIFNDLKQREKQNESID